MLTRSNAVALAAVAALACAPFTRADTGNFTAPLTNAFLSVDINGGPLDSAEAPTNGYNEDTTTGAFSADNFGVLWTGWGGNQYSGGDGVQLPSSQAANLTYGTSLTKTFTTSGSTYYGVSGTVNPPVTATMSIDTTNNSSDYATINGTLSFNSRDRGSPNGANGTMDNDMFRDFIFAGGSGSNIQSSNYIQLNLAGLSPNTTYQVALYSFDGASGAHSMNWTAIAPVTNANGITGYWPSATDNTNVFTAPSDEQTITWAAGSSPTPAPALFTETSDANGTLNFYGFGGTGTTADENADTSYLNGFQIAAVQSLLLGDANGDGKVDLDDLNIVLNHLGQTDSARADGNFDGAATIDLNDLNDVLNNLGTSSSPSGTLHQAIVATPEPATAGALLAFGAIALIRRRR